jgi:hypothetical protein
MRRANYVWAGLLAAALIASYVTWTAGPDAEKAEGVVLLEAKAEEIETVHFVSSTLDVLVTAKEDERGRYLWAKVVKEEERPPEKKPKPKPEPKPEPEASEDSGETGDEDVTTGAAETGEEAGGESGESDTEMGGDTGAAEEPPEPEPEEPPEPVIERVVLEFAVGDAGEKLLETLGPFEAKRALENVDDAKLEEFGLSEGGAMLTIQLTGSEPVTFEVGENSFGGGVMYVREPSTGKVYVIDSKALSPLTKADTRLANRTLFPGKSKDVTAVAVASEESALAFEHRNREDPEKQFWALADSDTRDDTAQAWLQKFFRLRSKGYVQAGAAPPDPLLRFSVRVQHVDEDPALVEVYSGTKADGEQGWYARSPHTRGLVELDPSLAEEIAQDVSAVLE